jgi:hypothetical protein
MVGNLGDARVGHISDRDSLVCGRFKVYVVTADTHTADDLALSQRFDDPSGVRLHGPYDHGVSIAGTAYDIIL